ncbi:hypothetical protein [Celeribacter persicus]|uniref:Uncharacterized protein n=1 Tax=Celeribacter persicus TaxID=1651082 RepID=A0A2T5HEY1_9RHOB|nr:hypothetical protein [Celeribacter persicus]PTQ70129.1 hypothetical protein C8N42_11011 [Celeribacter persicus]
MVSKKDTIVITLITVFIVTPAILALTAYFITQNPSLRPLGITVERLTEAGQLENKSLIIAVVDIGAETKATTTKDQYRTALETAFARMEAEVQVKFRSIPGSSGVNVTYLVGESRIGPFPIARAAAGVAAATQAERMVVAQRRAVEQEQERRAQLNRDGFWRHVMD